MTKGKGKIQSDAEANTTHMDVLDYPFLTGYDLCSYGKILRNFAKVILRAPTVET